MINKHLDKIDLNDLEQLRSNAVLEGKTIEYKKLLPTNSDADRKEFLADISSFANASGRASLRSPPRKKLEKSFF